MATPASCSLSGKVRDIYDAGDGPAAAGRDRPDQRLRRGPADADPRQGPRADRLSLCSGSTQREDLVGEPRAHARDRAEFPAPFDARRRRSRAARCWCAGADVIPIECVARGYLSGSGWAQYRDRGLVCGVAAARGPRRVRPAARADLHARPRRPTRATTCRSRPSRRATSSARASHEQLKELTLAVYERIAADARSSAA